MHMTSFTCARAAGADLELPKIDEDIGGEEGGREGGSRRGEGKEKERSI